MAPQLVWPLTQGQEVVVAIVDTGVSRAAPALAGAVRPGRDVLTGAPATDDCLGRGTALAGIVAARPALGSEMAGMAPAATVLPIRVVDANGRIPPGALAAGIRAAAAERATVILVGTGTSTDSGDLRAAVDAAVAADSLVVAAVTGADESARATYPAAYPQVLAVAAVGADGLPAGTDEVDLTAPAAGGHSIGPAGAGHYRVGGAAVAAAYVAGTAALVRSYHPGLRWSQVRDRLVSTAEPVVSSDVGTVDAYAAVSGVASAARSVPPPQAQPVRLPAPPGTDPAIRIAALAGSVLLGGAVVLAALVLTLRSARRRRPPWP
ncbi:S8 family serine peptidase [Micromonospora radicis]|nr:S8 family serine peptidase [Micromonospora radicis]